MRNILYILGAAAVGLLTGRLVFSDENTPEKSHDRKTETLEYTCAMHPQIRQSAPGLCPICSMELTLLTQTGTQSINLSMTPDAVQLANIQTSKVVDDTLNTWGTLQLSGRVAIDERHTAKLVSHFHGRIEKLHINFVGEKVRKGQVMAVIYSPELLLAQEELIAAGRQRDKAPELLRAAKNKLRNWKIPEHQIAQIIESGQASREFQLLAHHSGVVTKKNINAGDHAERGAVLFEIADLSKLWIMLDAYEKDLAWIKVGTQAAYKAAALPQNIYRGEISYIDPVINPKTRTALLRIEVDNKNALLKPEMFVEASIQTYRPQNRERSFLVPKSAILWTGRRSLVYVKKQISDDIQFELRTVELGSRKGDYYQVTRGLTAGEEVVSRGAFKVDAAAQLAGKPSMMTSAPAASYDRESSALLSPLIAAYLQLKDCLVRDDYAHADEAQEQLMDTFSQLDLSRSALKVLPNTQKQTLQASIELTTQSRDMKALRKAFMPLSVQIIQLARQVRSEHPLYILHCPMAANNQGADWLSLSDEILNPYFGSSMLRCGEVKQTIR